MSKTLTLVVVGVLLLLGGCGSAGAVSGSGTTVASARTAATVAPLTLTGQGSKVLQVDLEAGRYRVDWYAQGHDNFIVIVHAAVDHLLINAIPPDPVAGETYLSVRDTSTYVLEVEAPTLSWTITLIPL